jgi:carbon-monoxide dehydrogenase small subunit
VRDGRVELELTLNGKPRKTRVWPMARLLDVLRHELGATGTKEGCGEGECGACAVLIDGVLVNSCLTPAAQAAGARVETVEGLGGGSASGKAGAKGDSPDPKLSALQKAFLDHGGAQCGICTPGMIVAAHSLLERHPDPTMEQIREGLAGNLCRCTGYTRIYESVAAAARATGGKA